MMVHPTIKPATMKRIGLILLAFLTLLPALKAQDIDELLDEVTQEDKRYVSATFKSTRIISGHSIERMPEGQLDFRISHRFGPVNTGPYEFFGLDQALIHLSLEYGFTDWLMAGIGRGNYEKTYDGFLKLSILRQRSGKGAPLSLSYLSAMAINTLKWNGPSDLPFWDRASYVHQILAARKFGERISLELNPTFVHRNLVATELDPNDLLSMGIGGRFKITKRLLINAEYYYVVPPRHNYASEKTYNPLSIGVDIETGGHVFQLHATNSRAMIEKGFIGETTGRWTEGDIFFGFNISRVFTLKSN